MTDVDTTAADMLEDLHGDLDAAGIELVFAEMKDAVRQRIESYGLEWVRDRDAFYPTVGNAVRATARRRHPCRD
jgi:anti-anti-sigma regulatory factor